MPSQATPAARVAAGFFLQGPDQKWLLLRNRKRGDWGFPKGHRQADESLVAVALRECIEECGIAALAVQGLAGTLRYRLPSGPLKDVHYFYATTQYTRLRLSHEHDTAGWFTASGIRKRLSYPELAALFIRQARRTN